jgi:hypothetical protein
MFGALALFWSRAQFRLQSSEIEARLEDRRTQSLRTLAGVGRRMTAQDRLVPWYLLLSAFRENEWSFRAFMGSFRWTEVSFQKNEQ